MQRITCLFHSVDIFVGDAKIVVGTFIYIYVRIQCIVYIFIYIAYIIYIHLVIFFWSRNKYFKISIEYIFFINFFKYQTFLLCFVVLNIQLLISFSFKIFCEEICFCCIPNYSSSLQGKYLRKCLSCKPKHISLPPTHGRLFLFKKLLDKKTMIIHSWVFGKHFPKNEIGETVTSWKTTTVFVANDKVGVFKLLNIYAFWYDQ